MDLFNVRFSVQLAYGVMSVAAYVVTVAVLIRNWKQFDPYFSRLYIAQFIFNIWTYANSFVTLRLPQNTCGNCSIASFFLEHSLHVQRDSFPLNVFYTLHFQFAFVQFFAITLISVNRFTMIFFHSEYAKIWRLITYPCIALTFVPWFVGTWGIFQNRAYYEYVPSMNCYATRTTYDISALYTFLVYFMIGLAVLNLMINVASWSRVCRLATNAITHLDYSLFLMSFVVFVVQFSLTSVTVLNRMFLDDRNRETFWAQMGQFGITFGSDALTHSSPWLLLLFSSNVRSLAKKLFFRKAPDANRSRSTMF